jgi:hypothetical protein
MSDTNQNETETQMTSFRCPTALLKKAEELGNMLPLYGIAHQSRSGVLRLAIEYGLQKLEEEMRASTPVASPLAPLSP